MTDTRGSALQGNKEWWFIREKLTKFVLGVGIYLK
jgi:hypothetical protein